MQMTLFYFELPATLTRGVVAGVVAAHSPQGVRRILGAQFGVLPAALIIRPLEEVRRPRVAGVGRAAVA
jgi:hypothetical protein